MKALYDGKEVAVIDTKLTYIQSDIAEIKTSIKDLNGVFASREELAQVAKETEARLLRLEQMHIGPSKFVQPILTAITSSAITFLLISYLQRIKS